MRRGSWARRWRCCRPMRSSTRACALKRGTSQRGASLPQVCAYEPLIRSTDPQQNARPAQNDGLDLLADRLLVHLLAKRPAFPPRSRPDDRGPDREERHEAPRGRRGRVRRPGICTRTLPRKLTIVLPQVHRHSRQGAHLEALNGARAHGGQPAVLLHQRAPVPAGKGASTPCASSVNARTDHAPPLTGRQGLQRGVQVVQRKPVSLRRRRLSARPRYVFSRSHSLLGP